MRAMGIEGEGWVILTHSPAPSPITILPTLTQPRPNTIRLSTLTKLSKLGQMSLLAT